MKKINWNEFETNDEILGYLRKLPRYRNTPLKSAYWRGKFFLMILICRIFDLVRPLFIVLVTNNRCNLNCNYCYGKYGERFEYIDYSSKELLTIIDELKELGTIYLTLHGGESLLRGDLGEIFNYAKLKGFYISLNTNGYFIPKKMGELQCSDSICLSLDGSKETNDKNRGEGCYDKVIEAIKILKDHSMPTSISATLTRDSMGDMEFLAKLAEENNLKMQYSILYNYNLLKNKDSEVVMTDEEIRGTVRKILELKQKGYPIYYSDNVLEATINWPVSFKKMFFTEKEKEVTKDMNLIPCYHGTLKYQIDADGRVITCWGHDYSNAPNIKELGVAGALKACHERNICRHCTFLANNEHNALMDLGIKNIYNILRIQIDQALNIKKKSDNDTK